VISLKVGLQPSISMMQCNKCSRFPPPANIAGAVNVHTLSTWPEKQRVFIMCEEPAAPLMIEVLNQTGCDSAPPGFETTAYVCVSSFVTIGAND